MLFLNSDRGLQIGQLPEINRLRRQLGMKPVEPKKKKCMRCDKAFLSYGYNHRMCGCVNE